MAFAFDELAFGYDAAFSATALGTELRAMVWQRLDAAVAGRRRVLEIGCGTGDDAIHLAGRGHEVVATDASAAMLRVAADKAAAAGCKERIQFRRVPMEQLGAALRGETFDAVFSNFGAVNCARGLEAIVADVAALLAPGSPLVWVVMGRHVPWEWAWFLARGDARKAFRRNRKGGTPWRGLQISYPTPAELERALHPYFATESRRALGVVLPPTYASAWLERSPRALAALVGLERSLQRWQPLAAVADHYIVEARRRGGEPMLDASFSSLLTEDPPGVLGKLAGKVLTLGYKLTGLVHYDRFRLERVQDVRVLVIPSVANPKVLRTGAFFASRIDAQLIAPGMAVLDMGTGSGVCALFAARHTARVIAVDVSPAAVRCARLNALLNDLEDRIDIRIGDLFEPVAGQRFDLVMFNPPFYIGAPKDYRDAAWRSEDTARRFAAGLSEHLAPGGVALVLLSSLGDACALFERELHTNGFDLAVFARRRFVNETLTIVRATRPS